MLLVLVAVAILTYSSLLYFVEREVAHPGDFDCSQWRNQTTEEEQKYQVRRGKITID